MVVRRILASSLLALSAVVAAHTSSDAVPIPWKNCGKAGDVISVQKADASQWPPHGTPAPLIGLATFDPATGHLLTLRLRLLLGVDWTFDVEGVAGLAAESGFVALPESLLVSVQQPALPVTAGPYTTAVTLLSTVDGAQPISVNESVTVGQDVTSVVTNVRLSYEGASGFPMPPPLGGVSVAHVEMIRSDDERTVFCFDITIPGAAIVTAEPLPFGGLRHPVGQRFDVGQPVPFEWWYADADGQRIKSPAAAPLVFFRPCGTDSSQDVAASSFRSRSPHYNVFRRIWQFGWSTRGLPAGCYDVSLRSALTGQIDGPFPIHLEP